MRFRSTVTGLALLAGAHVQAKAGDTVCHDGPRFRVLVRPYAQEVGSEIVIRRRAAGAPLGACAVTRRPGDVRFALPGEPNVTDAQVLKVVEPYLFIDRGTGTLRTFVVYDMEQDKPVYTAETSEDVSFGRSGAEVWATAGVATASNCRDWRTFKGYGGSAAIVRRIVFDPKTGTVRPSPQTKCVYRE